MLVDFARKRYAEMQMHSDYIYNSIERLADCTAPGTTRARQMTNWDYLHFTTIKTHIEGNISIPTDNAR